MTMDSFHKNSCNGKLQIRNSSAWKLTFLLLLIFGLTATGQARPKIIKVESGKLVVGRAATLRVHGSGFKDITTIDAVKIGGVDVVILDYDPKTDSRMDLTIRVPKIEPGKHKISLTASGPAFTIRLDSQIGAANGPALELLFDNSTIQNGQFQAVRFDSSRIGSPVDKRFQVVNNGSEALELKEIELPEGFELLDELPDKVDAGNAVNFYLRLTAKTSGTFSGNIKIESNDAQNNPFQFKLSGNIAPLALPEFQVFVDGGLLESDSALIVDFGAVQASDTVSKIITIKNSGENEFLLVKPELPAAVSLDSNFPVPVAPGDSTNLTITLPADSIYTAGNRLIIPFKDIEFPVIEIGFSGNVIQQTAQPEPVISAALQDTVPLSTENQDTVFAATGTGSETGIAETPPMAEPDRGRIKWGIVFLIALFISVMVIGIPYLVKLIKTGGTQKAGRTKSVVPKLHFKSQKDFGSQQTSSDSPLKEGFELRLKPVLDYGRAEIHVADNADLFSSADNADKTGDDLTRIEGIGPVITELLNSEGFYTFSDIAGLNSDRIMSILRNAGLTIADPTTWPEQARLAADQQWGELDSLQERLKGGRIEQEA